MEAVDTKVLFDVLAPDSSFYEESASRLEDALERGPLCVCDIVYVEVASRFPRQADLHRFLDEAGIELARPSRNALYLAANSWREYMARKPQALACPDCGALNRPQCVRCGARLRARQRVISDFIIGAHALVDTDGLITRDHRYFTTYFPRLRIR